MVTIGELDFLHLGAIMMSAIISKVAKDMVSKPMDLPTNLIMEIVDDVTIDK